MVSISFGCPTTAPGTLARLVRAPRGCANRLMDPYSPIWTVCRIVNIHPMTLTEKLPKRIQFKMIGLIHIIRVCAFPNLNSGSLNLNIGVT